MASGVIMTGVVEMNSHGIFTSFTPTTLTLRHNRFNQKCLSGDRCSKLLAVHRYSKE